MATVSFEEWEKKQKAGDGEKKNGVGWASFIAITILLAGVLFFVVGKKAESSTSQNPLSGGDWVKMSDGGYKNMKKR